jgi:excisionase family DNA binding protein
MAGADTPATEALRLEPLMSIDDVAAVLRISQRGVYRLIRSGELLSLKVGHRTLFEPAEVRKFIASHRQACDPPRPERAA